MERCTLLAATYALGKDSMLHARMVVVNAAGMVILTMPALQQPQVSE